MRHYFVRKQRRKKYLYSVARERGKPKFPSVDLRYHGRYRWYHWFLTKPFNINFHRAKSIKIQCPNCEEVIKFKLEKLRHYKQIYGDIAVKCPTCDEKIHLS